MKCLFFLIFLPVNSIFFMKLRSVQVPGGCSEALDRQLIITVAAVINKAGNSRMTAALHVNQEKFTGNLVITPLSKNPTSSSVSNGWQHPYGYIFQLPLFSAYIEQDWLVKYWIV